LRVMFSTARSATSVQALLPGTDCPAPRNPPDHHVVDRHDLMQSRGAEGTEA
jgi:hypothetical protein